jgi:hypothetical protein
LTKAAQMYTHNRFTGILLHLLFCCLLAGCGAEPKTKPAFIALGSDRTGLHFTNKLTPTPQFNMFHYMYFYNGAGIGAGDFNNDGLIDLFFSSNQSANKLYLNTGNLKFKDVTASTNIPEDKGWSTGVSVVDINGDGLLDIYVCKVGNYETLHSKNQLAGLPGALIKMAFRFIQIRLQNGALIFRALVPRLHFSITTAMAISTCSCSIIRCIKMAALPNATVS